MDRLAAMKVFAEVARCGSFTAAAEHLDLSRVMVTRQVAALESWLQTRLLQRSTRRISLTEAGEVFLTQSRQMLELSVDMQERSGERDRAPRGQLRVTTSMSFGMAHLAAAIAEYLALYPDVSVDLLIIDRPVNLIEDRVDLAVRISGELDPNLVARRIAACRSLVCASPAYVARRGAPLHPADLAQHNCLTYSRFGKGEWRFLADGAETSVAVGGNLSANEATVLTQAARVGAGIALQPTYLVGPLIRSGELVRLLPDWQPPDLTIWGVYLSRQHVPATLRTLLDFLVQRFEGQPHWDAGINT
ncbi:MAG: LysR family transcriptional regulator [Rhodocyclales bacterium]|nr:LysR family transcriptional regulator [Rhodocyclales bacterium]